MSRTYRKGSRWINNYQGEYYHWSDERSVKYPFKVEYGDTPFGTNYFRVDVRVCDGDNFGRFTGFTSDVKRMYHRIDRARYKQALLRNGDTYIQSSFDPWDYD
jgi:hypothetical protein